MYSLLDSLCRCAVLLNSQIIELTLAPGFGVVAVSMQLRRKQRMVRKRDKHRSTD